MSRPRSVTVLGPAECGRLAADLRQMAPVREYNWQRILKVHCSVGAPTPRPAPAPARVVSNTFCFGGSYEWWIVVHYGATVVQKIHFLTFWHWYPLDHISCVINIVCDIIIYKISLEFEYYWSDELSQNLCLKARHSYSSKYQVSPNSYYVVPCAMMTILHS